MRIHITGASGSGTTTLGLALAERLDVPHLDSDHFFWVPTDPPFQQRRDVQDRVALLGAEAAIDQSWVLTGSTLKWGEFLEPHFTLIVFLALDPAVRMERLRLRELARFGDRISSDGDMAKTNAEFMSWAAAYDTAGVEQRSRAAHEAWLQKQNAPVLRLDSAAPVGGTGAAGVTCDRLRAYRIFAGGMGFRMLISAP